ncbi:TonB-dependent receptor [Phenylobacterium sp.]|jgi:outer membrane receptor protein involved in Fe transport|uniref:TonB-dependent receptor n=1 Tax=Phenylobacterium sp. TaxID=1871053 RepID=UPI002F409136
MNSSLIFGAGLAAGLVAAAQAQAAEPSPAGTVDEVVVTARRLDAARAAIQPDLGASSYTISAAAVANLPGGANTPLNQVVLQAPGVTQDSFGQLHVRGDHANLQYRLNGVILPEGLSVFGQTLSPRLADSVELITGALPAQYGLRTAGVVNITTKSGQFHNGGEVSLYGGSHGTVQPSFEAAGASGPTSFFASGSYLENKLGIESPDGRSTPHHDRTKQIQAFGYLDHILDAESRVSLIAGVSDQKFQIPQAVGVHAADQGYRTPAGDPGVVGGLSDYASENLNQNQRETTGYAIASYLRDAGPVTLQVSAFVRYSRLTFDPDPVGDLLFTGVAQRARKSDLAAGLQAEGVYKLTDAHTLRGGLIVQADRSKSDTVSQVFALDPVTGAQAGPPISVADASRRNARTYSVYIQDEWRPFEPLTINYGLRYDQVENFRNEHQVSPRVNVVWRATATTTAHAGYARYFTPSPFELIASPSIAKFVGTSAEPPNPDANTAPFAERSDYYDLGAEQRLGPFTLGVDAYLRQVKNLLDEGQFGAPIILTPFNYRDGRVKGVEFTANYVQGPFTAYGNFAISKAQGRNIVSSQFNFDPDELAYIATHYIPLDHDQRYTGSAGATWRWGATRASFDLLYGSGLRADGATPNGGKVPAYTVVNLGLAHSFGETDPVELRLDVINAFDKRYLIRDGSGVGVGQPQWGARRGVFVGISKRFG